LALNAAVEAARAGGAVFKPHQGTAEEAFALVARAVAYRRQCGSRESYLSDLSDLTLGACFRMPSILAATAAT